MAKKIKAKKSKTQKRVSRQKKSDPDYEFLKNLKLIGAIGETVLAIPLLGAIVVLATVWTILPIYLAFHIAVLLFGNKQDAKKTAPVMGIVAAALGWVPLVAMILHIITAILYWRDWNKM